MSKFSDRYTTAVHARSLTIDVKTTYSATDVLAAAGLARRRVPLGVALMRLFAGGGGEEEVVEVMADMIAGKANFEVVKLKRVQAEDIARAVLAWFSDGRCPSCNGLGQVVIKRTTTLRDMCKPCRGGGRLLFDRQFQSVEALYFARWLKDEIEHEQAQAGADAMRVLAPRLDL